MPPMYVMEDLLVQHSLFWASDQYIPFAYAITKVFGLGLNEASSTALGHLGAKWHPRAECVHDQFFIANNLAVWGGTGQTPFSSRLAAGLYHMTPEEILAKDWSEPAKRLVLYHAGLVAASSAATPHLSIIARPYVQWASRYLGERNAN